MVIVGGVQDGDDKDNMEDTNETVEETNKKEFNGRSSVLC